MPERIDFRNDEHWQNWASAFIETGNMAEASRRVPEIECVRASSLKNRSEDFRAWLREQKDERFEKSLDWADKRLREANSEDGAALTDTERKDMKLLFERTKRIETKIESNTTNNNYVGEVIPKDVRDDLARWNIEMKRLEEEMARLN